MNDATGVINVNNALLDEFLRQRTFAKTFCAKLIGLARQRARVSWETRCLAILMAEHQILKLPATKIEAFDDLFCQLKLKAPGLDQPLSEALLKEGYSTTELRPFIREFRLRLARLNRVHRKIRGRRTSEASLREFVEVSRSECKLTLARYIFTPEEVVDRIVKEIRVTDGIRDLDMAQPRYVDTEIANALRRLPAYEAGILRCLCEGPKIYWVSDATSSRINSLVEYPLTTVVLVIKPPGSDHEFELKRAGRRGDNPLGVVFRRNGNRVPSSHRLDGGSMQWLLRHEARSASMMSGIYRLVHAKAAPLPGYIARTTVFTIPTHNGPAPSFRYFTDPHMFGEAGFRQMRGAMKEAVVALQKEEGENLPAVAGDLRLAAEFLSHVAPAQTILSGTSSFRIDKLAGYLSAEGAETYFKNYRGVEYTPREAKAFADALLEEVLGVYESPPKYENYGDYLNDAFAVAANRARADEVFLTLVQQIAELWGTLLAVRGHSRGESFVARNVGLKSVWERGQWKVKLIFMDHDALSIPDHEIGHFFAQNVLPGMLLDERHVWGRANPALFRTTLVGSLLRIYRIRRELETEWQAKAEQALKAAYDKTHRAMLSDLTLRAFFSDVFLSRIFDWDGFAAGYLRPYESWEAEMRRMFAEKGYDADAFEYFTKAAERHRGFLERNAFLWSADFRG